MPKPKAAGTAMTKKTGIVTWPKIRSIVALSRFTSANTSTTTATTATMI